jgi:hypothetical protein
MKKTWNLPEGLTEGVFKGAQSCHESVTSG